MSRKGKKVRPFTLIYTMVNPFILIDYPINIDTISAYLIFEGVVGKEFYKMVNFCA